MSNLDYPLQSLEAGNWFKLICGASFQDLPSVRNLTLAYALAGADCIDVAADPAVIASAREAIEIAQSLNCATTKGMPWLMVSLNDGEDPHFRKAEFDVTACPPLCPRPCETICPADAIAFTEKNGGVIEPRCYGCGRCLPVCPSQLISTRSTQLTPTEIAALIEQKIDAVEIHTQVGHQAEFNRVWQAIAPWHDQLKLVAISCRDGNGLVDYLSLLYDSISPLSCRLIWQTDGRPMSGDLGIGATRAAVKLAQKVLAARLPGYVQLAGGTNAHTVTKLRELGLLNQSQSVSGVAYGSYARSLLAPILKRLDFYTPRLENSPSLLWEAVQTAHSLVSPLKQSFPLRPGFKSQLTSNPNN